MRTSGFAYLRLPLGLLRAARAESRVVFAVLAVGALAGCSLAPRETYQALIEVGPAEGPAPLADLPPAAGQVVAVLQNETRGVLSQRIVLKGDPDTLGENAIVVKVDRSRGPADYDGPAGSPTRARIAAEIDEAFAGIDMRMSETFARSSFGPFGYAVGRPRPRMTCVYAWSWGLAKGARLGEAPAGEPSLPTQPTSVRVRLCRSALGEAEIVQVLRGLKVYSPQTHMAYLDPGFAGSETRADALAAAGVGYFSGAAPPAMKRERLEPGPKPRKHVHKRWPRHGDDEERAVAEAPARARAAAPIPMPTAAKGPVSYLAPHADLPLPGRSRTAEAPAAARGPSVPLPN